MASSDDSIRFLDTPNGLITPAGTHFRTTRALLEEYAGPVFEVVPLAALVDQAEVWLRSGQTIALWSLALFLLLLPPVGAALCALTVYLGWETVGPALVGRALVATFRVLEQPVVQAVLFVAVLSVLGAQGEVGAVGVGLAGFMLMRWRLIPLAARPLLRVLRRPLYTLPVADQVLRALVLSTALHHRIELPQLERLKQDLRR